MEFNFNCEKLLGSDSEGFAIIDGKKGPSISNFNQNRIINRQLPDY